MGILDKWLEKHQDDWCRPCNRKMEKRHKQLFALPDMWVGHYCEHKNPDYYRKNLRAVTCKADIPAGMYACGAIEYFCPECGHRMIKMDVFLPVRDQEKHESPVLFENGELDDFLWPFFSSQHR